MTRHSVLPLKANPGMPPRQPLAMPIQDLKRAPDGPCRDRSTARIRAARLLTFGGAASLAAVGTSAVLVMLWTDGLTVLEAVTTILMAVTFGWISLAAASAIAGLIAPPAPHRRRAQIGGKLATQTALVMPIYGEDPVRTTAALEAMALGLHRLGAANSFEIVVLSDSTDADFWVGETLAVDRLRDGLRGVMPVWYRRRWANIAKKSGNIRDFVEKWGGRYDHFVVLDGDSLMAPETLVHLAACMEADPRLGILQSVPMLAGGETFYARLQQFAARIYGPVMAGGLSAWQGSDGTFWGHNAIIRTAAFAASCGLPELPGRKPLGGHILSHDFVEAALMRRAGWRVEMAPGIAGSWEECPPSLVHAAIRDRRWAQGNLQHSKVIAARGLTLVSRAHLAMGIMSYAASPLWLLLIAAGFGSSLQARFAPSDPGALPGGYLSVGPALPPNAAMWLFACSLVVLLLPKLLGLLRAFFDPPLRRGCGGGVRLLASFILELVVSALLAPIMMLIHSRHIYEILSGGDSGWAERPRDNGVPRWRESWRRHRWHTAVGVALAAAAWLLAPVSLLWLSATVAGLLLAVPLSRWSGSARLGGALRHAGLMLTPEETEPHPIFAARDEAIARTPASPSDGVLSLATDETVRAVHYRWASSAPRLRGAPDAAYLTATEKVREARTLGEALAWLHPAERIQVAGHRVIAEQIAGLPHDDASNPHEAEALPIAVLDRALDPPRLAQPAA